MSESVDRLEFRSRVYVYDFAEGRAGMAGLPGGRGATLAETAWLGLPAPAGHPVSAAVLHHQDPDGDGTR
jgi:phosphoenolpyruvate synthase/pyruvate phosphate dikinase